ncbi:DUF6889 family protein [Pseudomonas sp. GXZC]|uniref:DUF6889 family protein n=1 Tax=Pseudomonas sp. GXZC TaxID=3003351 RepID=UPI0022AB3BD8|nr:hypothetical protein [Pseudomonas sp. GXZC]WAT31816.1 hypothetical protein OZ428_16170 [Pseudomonas sp. GXZC]
MIARLLNAGLCRLHELKDGTYDWDDFWRLHDLLDLTEWVEWEGHVIAVAEAKTHGGR